MTFLQGSLYTFFFCQHQGQGVLDTSCMVARAKLQNSPRSFNVPPEGGSSDAD